MHTKSLAEMFAAADSSAGVIAARCRVCCVYDCHAAAGLIVGLLSWSEFAQLQMSTLV